MDQQDDIDHPTQPRNAWLLWWREHRIDMNRHRETCLQPIIECRSVIWFADTVLARTIHHPLS